MTRLSSPDEAVGAAGSSRRLGWKYIGLLLVVVGAAAFGFQGSRGLWESTEGRYAECAREMLETGRWFEPTLDYAPHWTKPPLTYWAIAGGMALVGPNEWGLRLYNAVALVILVLAVARLGAVLWDAAAGRVAGLIAATAPFTVLSANVISTDFLLALWVLLAILAYWTARRRAGTKAERGWVILMWLFLGLGFLTKGPPALLGLLVIVLFNVLARWWGQGGPRLLSPVGLVLFAAVGLGWYAWAVLTHPGLLSYWLGHEVVGRAAGEGFHRSPEWYKPFIMYLPALAFGAGLWAALAPWVMWKYRELAHVKTLAAFLRRTPQALFLVIWVAVPLVFFFLWKSRMLLYVLPLFPAVTLVTARGMVRLVAASRLPRALVAATVASLLLMIGMKAVLAYVPTTRDERPLGKTCRALLDPHTHFVLCSQTEKYGLEFYLDGRMERVTLAPGLREGLRDVEAVLNEVKSNPAHGRYVFIVRQENLDRLRKTLEEARVPYAPYATVDRYTLLVVTHDAGARDGLAA